MFLAKMFSSNASGKDSLVVDEAGANKLTRLEVANIRFILFDSSNMEKVSNSKSGLFAPPG
jgi:hypothetical protein